MVLAFDATRKEDLLSLKDWMELIQTHVDTYVPVFVLANKCDLLDEPQQNALEASIAEQRLRHDFSKGILVAHP